MSGALLKAKPDFRLLADPAYKLLVRAASEVSGREAYALCGWNDEQGRTKEEVLQAFDIAIELAQAEDSL